MANKQNADRAEKKLACSTKWPKLFLLFLLLYFINLLVRGRCRVSYLRLPHLPILAFCGCLWYRNYMHVYVQKPVSLSDKGEKTVDECA